MFFGGVWGEGVLVHSRGLVVSPHHEKLQEGYYHGGLPILPSSLEKGRGQDTEGPIPEGAGLASDTGGNAALCGGARVPGRRAKKMHGNVELPVAKTTEDKQLGKEEGGVCGEEMQSWR